MTADNEYTDPSVLAGIAAGASWADPEMNAPNGAAFGVDIHTGARR